MQQKANGLYDPRFEHDNCGIGAIVNIKGNKDHEAVEGALGIVEHLEHRAGKDAEGGYSPALRMSGEPVQKHPAHGDPAGGDRLRRTGQPAVPVAGADQAGPGAGAVF